MASARKLIRAYIQSLLATGIEIVPPERIFGARLTKLFPEEIPCITIYERSESAAIEIAAPREYKRTLRLAVHITVKHNDDAFDMIDDIAESVEQKIFRDETLNGLVSDSRLSDTEIDFNYEGDQPTVEARLVFDCEYYTLAPEVQPNLDNFVTVHSETTVEPDNGQDPAIDEVTLVQS